MSEGVNFPKTLVFIRTYKDCSDLYLALQHKLGDAITDAVDIQMCHS